MYVFLDISGVENSYSVCSMFCHHPFVWSISASRWLQCDELLGWKQILVLLLHAPFLPMIFLAVVSVVDRKSTTQKINFRTVRYKGIC